MDHVQLKYTRHHRHDHHSHCKCNQDDSQHKPFLLSFFKRKNHCYCKCNCSSYKTMILNDRFFNQCHDNHSLEEDDEKTENLCEFSICDDRFKLRLGGLHSGLNFRLRQLIGCTLQMKVEYGDSHEDIFAKICYVGSDFVEVRILNKHEEETLGDKSLEEVVEKIEKETTETDPSMKKLDKRQFVIYPIHSIKMYEIKAQCHCDCRSLCQCYKS